MPCCNKTGISFIDSLFVSIAALTTTGLQIVSIPENFNLFAEIIIAVLMNIGAIGFLSLVAVLWKMKSKKISWRDLKHSIGKNNYKELKTWN